MSEHPAHTFGASSTATTPDGRHLHVMTAGAGDVTVLLESGLGMSRSTWGLVVPGLTDLARTVVYDRAGLGRSDDDDQPRRLARIVDDLVAVLDHLGDAPVVLVGHSWGGAVARATAARLGPGRVRGLVVVDQVDENCALYFEPSAKRRFGSTKVLVTLARLGVYRPLAGRPGTVQPADVRADHLREDFTVRAATGMVAEMEHFLDDLADLRDDPLDLHGIPLTVITGTRPTRLDRKVRTAVVAAHRRTAELVPGARLVEAPGSAHLVMFDDPAVVVEAVRAHVLRIASPPTKDLS